ncbi:MAG: Gfo/Idh/MocA family oxidoreductase [Gemmatimonadota bacterium]
MSAAPAQRVPRIGVIGAGALGFHHVRLLSALDGIEFMGFFDERPVRAAEVSAELKVRRHESVDGLISACDAVTIVVPTSAHFSVAKRALEQGKHVLIEKPLTSTLEEADELLAIAQKSGSLIQTGHVERFNRAIRAAAEYIDGPRFVVCDRLAPFNPRGTDVAVVLDLMIHDIDLILTLVGGQVAELAAVGVPVLSPYVDIANARLTFASGAVANITASRVSVERTRKLRIFQPSGYMSLDLATGQGVFYRLRKGVDLAELARGPLAVDAFVDRISLSAPEAEPLKLEFESFAAAVRGESPVVVTGAAGREALDVALRIVREIERSLPALAGGALTAKGA